MIPPTYVLKPSVVEFHFNGVIVEVQTSTTTPRILAYVLTESGRYPAALFFSDIEALVNEAKRLQGTKP